MSPKIELVGEKTGKTHVWIDIPDGTPTSLAAHIIAANKRDLETTLAHFGLEEEIQITPTPIEAGHN